MVKQLKKATDSTSQWDDIRTIKIDEELWFVLKDLCVKLGIEDLDQVVKRLDKDGVCLADVTDSLNRTRNVRVINKPNLISFLSRSNKPEAFSLLDWMYQQVIAASGSINTTLQQQQEILQLRESNANYLEMLQKTVTMPGLSGEGLKHIESFGTEQALLQLRETTRQLEAKEGEKLTRKDLQKLRKIVVDVCCRVVDKDTDHVVVSKKNLQQDQIIVQLQSDLKQLQQYQAMLPAGTQQNQIESPEV